MKKFVSLLLVLMMACMILPAAAEESFVGTWYLVDIAGMNPADMGISMFVTLNEDGTIFSTLTSDGETVDQEGTWTVEGEQVIITVDDDPQAFDYVDGNLQTDMGGGTIGTFSREEPSGAKTEFAEVNPDAAPEDFNGSWKAAYISAEGKTLNIDAAISMGQFGEAPVLTFENGKFTITGDLSTLLGGDAFEMTFDSGVYSYGIDLGGVSMGFFLSLLQDGMLELKISVGEDMCLYFVRAE